MTVIWRLSSTATPLDGKAARGWWRWGAGRTRARARHNAKCNANGNAYLAPPPPRAARRSAAAPPHTPAFFIALPVQAHDPMARCKLMTPQRADSMLRRPRVRGGGPAAAAT